MDAVQHLPLDSALPALADPEFDRMAALTRRLLDAPVALVSLPNRRCQVFPGAAGADPDMDAARSNGLEYSYCKYVVQSARPLIISDMRQDPNFASHLATTELGFLAYAGMPLHDDDGVVIGSLCALDTRPRQWSTSELEILGDLAEACSSQLQLRIINARTAVTADRDRIGRELGNGVIREMFGLSMQLGNLRSQVDSPTAVQLTTAIDAIDSVISKIRSSIYDVVS